MPASVTVAPPAAEIGPERARRAEDRAEQSPYDPDHRHHREDPGGREQERGADLVALPVKDHFAGAVGKPRSAERHGKDDDEIDEDADHAGV